MKKSTRIIALFLTIITLMSSMSIMAGAISSKSSAKELLDYYENCIITTSAKEDVVKANEVYKYKDYADYSSLKGEDLKETKAQNEEWEMYDGKWYEEKYETYYYCDAYEDYYWEGRSQFIDFFSIKRDIRRLDLNFKSAKYAEDKNGKVTLTFVYLYTDEDYSSTMTYTVKINSKNYVESYSLKDVEKQTAYSIEDNPYTVTGESISTYKFVYNKVDAEAIEIPEKTIVLGKYEEYTLDVEIKPDNATFKHFYIDDFDMDWDVADWYVDENDEYVIYAAGPGKTTFDICTYSGDIVETVEVIVEYTFVERIAYFFENLRNEFTSFFDGIFDEITWFFEDLFYTEDYEEDFYEDEYYEDEVYCGGVIVE